MTEDDKPECPSWGRLIFAEMSDFSALVVREAADFGHIAAQEAVEFGGEVLTELTDFRDFTHPENDRGDDDPDAQHRERIDLSRARPSEISGRMRRKGMR